MEQHVLWYRDIDLRDIDRVGGKNASLGEMIQNLAASGVLVPDGFATTADAYRSFLQQSGLEIRLRDALADLDVSDIASLARTGAEVRNMIAAAPFPALFERSVRDAFSEISANYGSAVSWAVRSSATAEDLPDASFAGQQETFLNVSGIEDVLRMIKQVFVSLFNDRAIAYRTHLGYPHEAVAICAGVQFMVRSDIGASGVMFTIDTESGFDDAVFVTSSYGLGEAIVQGSVNPDEFYVYKPGVRAGRPAVLVRRLGEKATQMIYGQRPGDPAVVTIATPDERRSRFSLTDNDLTELARQAIAIEHHYGRPMDIEWGKDGLDGKLYILQARPVTALTEHHPASQVTYRLDGSGEQLLEGRAVGQRIGAGRVRILTSIDQMESFFPGEVLVADMTDPDWEPVMAKASAIVTNRGGRTCHAAIIARELGIPAVVGTGDGTAILADVGEVTVSCAGGATGAVYRHRLPFTREAAAFDPHDELPVRMMMNIASPEQAFTFARLPNHGVGLARLEFIINRQIGIHPMALIEHELQDDDVRAEIDRRSAPYGSPRNFYVQRLAEGIAMIAAAFAPNPVIVRTSDFKSNEYANMIGGARYEPREENPMLGLRGASRYLEPAWRTCFDLECQAIRLVRETMDFTNVKVMIPFVRTPQDGADVVSLLAENGLVRGDNGLEIYMMCELPINAILADEFLESFDGFSIGSNDLTQLTLGLDRDSSLVAASFDERNEAVKFLMARAIAACRRQGKYIGICGQGPSDHPELGRWLLEQGVTSISLNPDTIIQTWLDLQSPSWQDERFLSAM